MVEHEDNWDGEGSLGYSEETWQRAARLAVRSAERYASTHGRPALIPSPAIMKGPEGGVAILWRWGSKQLLIDVPVDDEPVTYHGFDRQNPHRETKGMLDLADDNEWMLDWLSQ
jgi:hypothetical protein